MKPEIIVPICVLSVHTIFWIIDYTKSQSAFDAKRPSFSAWFFAHMSAAALGLFVSQL